MRGRSQPEWATTALAGPGEVSRAQAHGGVRAAYDRLGDALGTGHVPTVFRILAVHEVAFVGIVELLAPVLAAARRLGVDGHIRGRARAGLPPRVERVEAGANRDTVLAVLERYNRANPLNLIAVLLLVGDTMPTREDVLAPVLPDAIGGDGVGQYLRDIRACHGGVVVPGVWRELFRTPEVAGPAWAATRRWAGTGAVGPPRAGVLESARHAADPATAAAVAELLVSRPAAERDRIGDLLAWFPTGIATMVVEIEFLKAMLGPPTRPQPGEHHE